MSICLWGEHKWVELEPDPLDADLNRSKYYKCQLCGSMSANHFNESDTPSVT